MRVTVKLFAGFREGRFKAEVLKLKAPMTIYELAQEHEIPHAEVGIVLCNGRHVEFERELNDGDVLAIFPKVGGG
ncbi:MoaD/ThiS family protein [bacterium]|nr:MoaD/ThiS family protein [bacterium]